MSHRRIIISGIGLSGLMAEALCRTGPFAIPDAITSDDGPTQLLPKEPKEPDAENLAKKFATFTRQQRREEERRRSKEAKRGRK